MAAVLQVVDYGMVNGQGSPLFASNQFISHKTQYVTPLALFISIIVEVNGWNICIYARSALNSTSTSNL